MSSAKRQALKLDVGGGLFCKEGFVNVDPYAEGEGVVRAPAWALPYTSGAVDEINCSHMLEHVEKRAIMPTLTEFYRVLKPGGLLAVEVPDLVWCCENWLKVRDNGWALDAIFGNQDPPGGQFHLTGFTTDILSAYLNKAGFVGPYLVFQPFSHEQKCIHIEVFKPGK